MLENIDKGDLAYYETFNNSYNAKKKIINIKSDKFIKKTEVHNVFFCSADLLFRFFFSAVIFVTLSPCHFLS